MFRSSTIIRELALNLAKVIFTLKHWVKLRHYLLGRCVACHGMACVVCCAECMSLFCSYLLCGCVAACCHTTA